MTAQHASFGPVGVVGLGSVGQSLVELLSGAGIDVLGVDCDPGAVARARGRAPGSVLLGNDFSALSAAEVVIEAVPEHYESKALVLRTIAETCQPGTVLVSTTASLSLASLAVASGQPGQVVGLAFLAPPAERTGVELVVTAMSSADAAAKAKELLELLPIAQKDLGAARGHAWDLVLAYLNRSVALYEVGYATREDIDTAMRLGCGLPTGPLALLDRIGLDVAQRALTDLHERTGIATHAPTGLLNRMVEGGLLGRKAGQGFYTYSPAGEIDSEPERSDRGGAARAREINRVGVVGSGTMARGIAQVITQAGLETVLVARDEHKADAAVRAVDESLVRAVRRGRVTPDQRRAALSLLIPSASRAAVADCDLVIEATAEEIEIKAEVFAELDGICKKGAILATTTSSLSVTACAEATKRRGDVVGMHFFNPAPAMKLVEVSRTEFTDDDVLTSVHALASRLRKTTVDCSDRAGFIVNYLLFPYLNDAIRLVESGAATVPGLDAAIESGFGYPMGPFTLLDTIGLDISEAIQWRLHEINYDPDVKPATLLTRLVELGRLGRKTGAGFWGA
ncbi:3-hydroxyacyl-CoA dehydrogenase family protein [Allokutzneria sp. NRRL B-24872]|uniref:3-hydroxyacyl-CoA dehydrogenase family protein n=1 Tax=Allokutzneria sp. NRRL B-24872 TaxID=1137961 RepID=UPI000A37BA11|nr:3-hydroxyacyl-CoA dehydrogenase family protein [Allokutzneria sp. NRRL B-24872]